MSATCEIETPAVAAPEVVETPANVCVWLVDDNDRFREMMAEFLGKMGGINCARDFSSPDALLSALASQIGPDVILLDIHMRDRNGLDAIGSIKALSRDTQVMMLTSMYDTDGYNRALAEGASDFLLKSYTPEEIVSRIRNPSRRVNARRRRSPSTSCAATAGRVPAKPTKTIFSGRLKFFRSLLG